MKPKKEQQKEMELKKLLHQQTLEIKKVGGFSDNEWQKVVDIMKDTFGKLPKMKSFF